MAEITAHSHNEHRSLWPLAALGAAGALIATPYLLPLVGLGDAEAAKEVVDLLHPHTGGGGSGVAGFVASGLGKIPGIGTTLAAGGWGAIATSSLLGIGGVLVANWMEKREDPTKFAWSKVIRYGSLATSMLISLPAILTGISVGIAFLSSFFISNAETFNSLVGGLKGSLGTASMAVSGGSSGGLMATLLPHLFSCGFPLIPTGLAMFLSGKKPSAQQAARSAQSPGMHCSARMVAISPVMQGQPCELAFQLVDDTTSRALDVSELETVHTRKLHTMIVDSSLRDYHHIHPEYDPARRLFVCRFTPNLQTNYAMWNDFTVKGEAEPTHTRTQLSTERGRSLPARVVHTGHVEGAGVSVDIRTDGPLRAGAATALTLDIRDSAGRPVTDLEPIMGAYAHLAAFSADGQHFIHTHPMGPEPQTAADLGASPLHFHVAPETAGPVQFFLQIQRGGRILTLPFGQMVAQDRAKTAPGAAGAQLINTIAVGR